jgi:hypothetical protein
MANLFPTPAYRLIVSTHRTYHCKISEYNNKEHPKRSREKHQSDRSQKINSSLSPDKLLDSDQQIIDKILRKLITYFYCYILKYT